MVGPPAEREFVHVLDLDDDGRISRYQEYTDTWVLNDVTGHRPT